MNPSDKHSGRGTDHKNRLNRSIRDEPKSVLSFGFSLLGGFCLLGVLWGEAARDLFLDASTLNSVVLSSLLKTGQMLKWHGPLCLELSSFFCVLWWKCMSFFGVSICMHVHVCRSTCACMYLCVCVCMEWRSEVNIR